ncbi:MAG TPA: ATP-dependent DNA helicase [Verrucomicrobiae bacterium]|nr:ATP-dependent DNA helicase [Verrucomicrobiae bacterium]
MNTFASRYHNLNPAQKQAVDTIEGPVMVIAGPGTGKTELLSMRVANILTKTDVLPANILCLTFTESGAAAMRERLVRLMGPAAYHVAIHTFHSFGSDIIHSYPNYFYHGAHFRPADELSSHEILQGIFEKLPYDDPLASRINNEFTQIRDTQNAISELKRSGLTPDELLKTLDHNDQFIVYANPAITAAFEVPVRSKAALAALEPLREHFFKFQESALELPGFTSLSKICAQQFSATLDTAHELGKTTPITAWRAKWCEKDIDGRTVLKDTTRSKKLRSLSHVYYEYLIAMQSRELYDFDDMILRVLHAIELFPELRYNLQEQFQYILVDEFQDTNGAQLRILLNLTNNEAQEGQPNILVVGDDDQAIYSFQGAELSNILTFREHFKDAKIITLTDNYRSVAPILTAARSIITQGQERLENQLDFIDKTLTPHKTANNAGVQLAALPTLEDEYYWLAKTIRKKIQAGHTPAEIAVLTRTHKEIMQLLPYLQREHIAVNYERRDNILESPPIKAIELVARVLQGIAEQRFDEVQARLPELLAHPAWGIAPYTLWELSLAAHKEQRFWLEVMFEQEGRLQDIAKWLVTTAHIALHESLETTIDTILGSRELQAPGDEAEDGQPLTNGETEEFVSPLRSYFFPHDALEEQPEAYLAYLEALRTIRQKFRDYQPDVTPTLAEFLRFIDLHRQTGTGIASLRTMAQDYQNAICVMTAHKSKGLEFDTVFVVNAADSVWGSKARTRSRTINFPANLPISPAGDTTDERLRLFYVATTRAKTNLLVSYSHKDSAAKDSLKAYFLQTDAWQEAEPALPETPREQIAAAESRWQQTSLRLPKQDMATILKPVLENYKLSATHLNNFIDITTGGPQTVLLQNLLRFPQAMAPSAAFGSAIHQTLQRAHAHFSATGKRRPVEDILRDFEVALTEWRLSPRDHEQYLQKGSDTLHAFLAARYGTFTETDIAEKAFGSQGVVVGNAKLTGAIDLLRVNQAERTVTITDYKTGKAAIAWHGKTDQEKIKLHRYKQQLLFYKLLVEKSRDFKNYAVTAAQLEFVEPDKHGRIATLGVAYEAAELARFENLITAVWRHIQALDFPDVSKYEPNFKDIQKFEQDLVDGAI